MLKFLLQNVLTLSYLICVEFCKMDLKTEHSFDFVEILAS